MMDWPDRVAYIGELHAILLKTKIFILATLTFLFLKCRETNPQCIITFEKIRQSDGEHILINQPDKEIEDKSFATKNIGGYYSFYQNGLIKSYYFFTSTGTTYDKGDKSNELIEDGITNKTYDFCSYAELYDSLGQLKKVFGNPLVLKEVELLKNGRINVTLHFFAFNKFYDYVNVQTNTGNTFQLTLTKDNAYSNMEKTFFSFNFRGAQDIKIYIQTNFLNCINKRENLSDTILVNSKLSTEKNGM